MDQHSTNRYGALSVDDPDTGEHAAPVSGRASRSSGRRSASLSGRSDRPNLKDLADAALNERAAATLDALQKLVNKSPERRGRVRKLGEFAPDGTPRAERTARAERWARANRSMSSLGGESDSGEQRALGEGRLARADEDTLRGNLSQAAAGPPGHVPETPQDDGKQAGDVMQSEPDPRRPSRDPDTGATILWPTRRTVTPSGPVRPTVQRAVPDGPAPQRTTAPDRLDGPNGSSREFKAPRDPARPSHRQGATVKQFDVDAGVWRPFTQSAPRAASDSLGSAPMEVSPPHSFISGLRSVKQEDEDADSWLRSSVDRSALAYSPMVSPTGDALEIRRERRRRDSAPAAPGIGAPGSVLVPPTSTREGRDGRQDMQRVPPDADARGPSRDGLTDDDEDMYVENDADVPRLDDGELSGDDSDLATDGADEDYVATDADREAAGDIDPAFAQTKVPMRAAARTDRVIDGTMAGVLWAGVDPSTLSHWAKLAGGSFGLRVHSVDGDTNISGFNSVQLKLDLQNTVRCTEPGSDAMLAPGRAAPGSPPAAPGLFLIHNISRQTEAAWTSQQFMEVGRYCLVVFTRDHGDSDFVGTWAGSTMPCQDLETGLRDRCRTAGKIRTVFREVEEECKRHGRKGQGKQAFLGFLNTISVRPLVIKPRGSRGVEVTEYNVYTGDILHETKRADGSFWMVPLSSERRLRLHEAMLEITVPDALHGAAVRRSLDLVQYDCSICASKSHPRGKCPALDIPTWGKSRRRSAPKPNRARRNQQGSRRSPAPQPQQQGQHLRAGRSAQNANNRRTRAV